MGVVKALFKLMILVVIAAAFAGVVMMVKGPGTGEPVSFEQWPEVPRNPSAPAPNTTT